MMGRAGYKCAFKLALNGVIESGPESSDSSTTISPKALDKAKKGLINVGMV